MTNEPVCDILDSAEALLNLQATVNWRMMDLSGLLSQRAEIKSVTRVCEVHRYQTKVTFDVFVDVETKRDLAFSFCFQFGSEKKRWFVEASISETTRDGQHVLEDHPESSPTSLEELELTAMQVIEWLIRSVAEFKFDAPSHQR